ncbi:MAG: ABC transporter permease [Candidatus Moranbacteria bacterium]|nr:ABC transporter permease [Candidatus Moranbacteria bacterium]
MFRLLILSFRNAYANLLASKARTFLTILGVVIGVGAVGVVMSVGASAQNLILDQIRGVGSNLIAILPGASDESGPPASVFGIVTTTLKNGDLDAIRNPRYVSHLGAVSGYVTGNFSLRSAYDTVQSSIQGVSSEYVDVEKTTLSSGRFFTSEENDQLSRVVVLGSERSVELFGERDPVGSHLKIGNTDFLVIGVLEERGSVAFSNPDMFVFVPLLTAQKILLGTDYLNFIRAKVDREENIDVVREDIRTLLRSRHGLSGPEEDDFSVRSIASALALVSGVTDVLRFFLVGVAAVSLIVGGIGIMNVMFIVLGQRIREIGLRKALGARRRDIFFQFVFEAIFISLCGGLVGFLLGIFVTWFVSIVVVSLGYDWDFLITFDAVLLAFLISMVLGIVFGSYPARRASRVSPIEALRYE